MKSGMRLLFAAIDFVAVFALLRWLDVGEGVAVGVSIVSAVTTFAVLSLAPRSLNETLERRWWTFFWAGVLGLAFGLWWVERARAYPVLIAADVVLSLLMIGYGLHFRSLGRPGGREPNEL